MLPIRKKYLDSERADFVGSPFQHQRVTAMENTIGLHPFFDAATFTYIPRPGRSQVAIPTCNKSKTQQQ